MKRIHFIIIAAGMIISAASCKKWLDVNTDPANPQIGTAEILLSPIQWHMTVGTANDYRFLFKTVQNWSSPSADNNWEAHGYEPALDNGGTIWRMNYVNHGPNLQRLLDDATQNGKWTFAGIGYAIKAWGYQLTTDLHGPIILDQALDTTRLLFNYQDQPEVYARVREWCDSALVCFSRTDAVSYAAILGSADLLYKGDRDKWKKFVYAVLAQQYSHLINKPNFASQYADSVIKYVDLSFASAAEDATVLATATSSGDANVFSPSASSNLVNITSNEAIQQWTGRISQPVVSMLTGGVRGTPAVDPSTSIDPRLTRMIPPNKDGKYRGIIPTAGDPSADKRVPLIWNFAVNNIFPSKYLYISTTRYPIMSYAQLQFAKAEALFIKQDAGGALTAYQNGIRGHMDFVNLYGTNNGDPKISATEANNYMTSTEVAQNSGELRLSDIMTQKYIAQWGWAGMETFNDLRKYHYDTAVFKNLYFYQPEDLYSNNKGEKCYRFRPRFNSEYVWNRTELAKWGALDPDYNTKKTWAMTPDQ